MNKEIIHHAIANPELITDPVVLDLEKISDQYPYFGAAQVLLSRAYRNLNDHRFTDQLHQASIYTGDRSLLYELLKQSPVLHPVDKAIDLPETSGASIVPFEITEINDKETLSREASSELAELILAEDSLETPPEAISGQSEKIIDRAQVTEIQDVSADEFTDRETSEVIDGEKVSSQNIEYRESDPLQREILLQALQSSMDQEVQPKHTEEDISTENNSYAAMIYRRSQRIHFGETENDATADADLIAEEKTTLHTNDDLADEDREEVQELPAFGHTPLSHGVQRIQIQDNRSHQRDLIDRFIHLEPNITRGKLSEYPTGNIAKESVEEDFSIVTETIAQLFARQGKLDKARKAYKKLIELHPEKSIYFAAQLKNLDKLKK